MICLGMVVDQLDIAPRILGRAKRAPAVELVRAVTAADLALLETEKGSKPPSVKRLTDRHHSLARCLAQGMEGWEAAAITGYDPSRISILKSDPTFKELIEFYRRHEDAALAEFTARASMVTLTALNRVQEMLDDDENPVSLDEAMTVAKTFADRTGHAPVAKTVNTNVNVELGAQLDSARARLRALPRPPQLTVVEAEYSEVVVAPIERLHPAAGGQSGADGG